MLENFKIEENMVYYFSASWCMPCKQMKPIIEKLKNIKIVDIEENPIMTEYFDIMSVPTFVSIKEGKEFKRFSGIIKEEKLKKMIEEVSIED